MKFELKIIGDTSNERDRRILRETALLLNSGVSASAVSVAQVDDDNDDEEIATIQPGEVDANGLPWDERIHSGGKTKTKAGVWRTAKGVGDDVINAVTAELRARGFVSPTASPTIPVPTVPAVAASPVQTPISTTIPVPTPAAAPVPVAEGAPVAAAVPTPVAAPVPVAEGAPVAAAVPTPVAAPIPVAAAVPTPVAAPAPAAMDFATLMGIISASAQTGKIDGAYLAAICAEFGLGDNLATLAAMPDKIPQVHMKLLMDGKL